MYWLRPQLRQPGSRAHIPGHWADVWPCQRHPRHVICKMSSLLMTKPPEFGAYMNNVYKFSHWVQLAKWYRFDGNSLDFSGFGGYCPIGASNSHLTGTAPIRLPCVLSVTWWEAVVCSLCLFWRSLLPQLSLSPPPSVLASQPLQGLMLNVLWHDAYRSVTASRSTVCAEDRHVLCFVRIPGSVTVKREHFWGPF